MTEERLVGNGFEGSYRDLIEAQSRNLPEETEENHINTR
jgi:hypothetical protein